jgi:hypothetical protein
MAEDNKNEGNEANGRRLADPLCFFINPLVFEAILQDDANDDSVKRAGFQMLSLAQEVANPEVCPLDT